MSCTTSGARPIDGSSSSSRRGLAISARPIASICCSPPDRLPASAVERARAGAETAPARARDRARCAPRSRAAVGAEFEVLAHRQRGQDRAAFGHLHQAALDDPVRSAAASVPRLRSDRPGRAACTSPDSASSVVDLPAPLAPTSVRISPAFDFEVDALHRFDVAVGDLQAVDVAAARSCVAPDAASSSSSRPR